MPNRTAPVMAGLDPAIHFAPVPGTVPAWDRHRSRNGRLKPGHDGGSRGQDGVYTP